MSAKLEPLFSTLTHGVYVIGVAAGEHRNAFTAAWVMQTSFAPPMLALSINPLHASYALLKAGRSFTVNVLGSEQRELALHFAKPMTSGKLASVRWRGAGCGAPILDEAMAWFECEMAGEHPSGDHVLVVGRVVNGGLLKEEPSPMNYLEMSGADSTATLLPENFPS